MTKYIRQLVAARKLIKRKGMLLTWYKPGDPDPSDPTPEFPELFATQQFPDTPIVFYPADRLSLGTVVIDPVALAAAGNLFAALPGDVPFKPEENDSIVLNGSVYHVNYVNTTMPDGTPLVYEVGLH